MLLALFIMVLSQQVYCKSLQWHCNNYSPAAVEKGAVSRALCHCGNTQRHAELYIWLAVVSDASDIPVSLTLDMQRFKLTKRSTTVDCSINPPHC